ncbi:MAG: aminotransferase class I/II-fold pyridoxal phosphate-dependent enzyme [Terriglobia bacterium]
MPRNPSTLERMDSELRELAERSQLRSLSLPQGIDFNSNDYLGLGEDSRLREAVMKGLADGARMGSGGSRLLSGNARVWEELEEEFAAFVGADAALFFTSGYAANIGLLSSVIRKDDLVFSDSANHASIIDGIRFSGAGKVIFPHRDWGSLESELRRFAGSPRGKFIVVESLFSMDGDRSPIRDLANLADRYGAELIVDEAHAVGVLGPQGRGLVAEGGASRQVLASVYPCGKALASAGAFVCGSPTLKQFLINQARTFIFNTALPPYFARQIRAAIQAVTEGDVLRTRVQESSCFLREQLHKAGFNTGSSDSHITPVILGANDWAVGYAEGLSKAGLRVRAIRPPSVPAGTARLRLSVTAKLKQEDLRAFAARICQVREQLTVPAAAWRRK